MTQQKPEGAPRSFTFKSALAGIIRASSYVAEHRKEFIFLCSIALLSGLLDPIATFFFSRIIKGITNPYVMFGVISASLGFFIFWILTTFLSVSLERLSHLRISILDEKTRIKFYVTTNDRVLHLPLSFHKSTNTGALWDKINTAGNAIGDIFSNAVIKLAPQLLTISVMVIISFFVNWIFGIIFILGILAYVLSVSRSAIPNAFLQREVQATYRVARAHATDTLANVRAVKDFTAEENEYKKSAELFGQNGLSTYINYAKHISKTQYLQRMIIFTTRAVTLFLSLYFITKGVMTVADLVLFNVYVGSIFTPLAAISQQWWSIQKSLLSLEDAEEVLKVPTEVYVPETKNISMDFKGELIFDKVSFAYESGQTILDDVSFEVKAGEVVALVGESGVGKSTTMDLISAYHFATKGIVLMDGIDVKCIPLTKLRSQIAVVPQETVLFNDTIFKNLRYGNFHATDEEVFAAARKAHCFDFIQKFPDTWDTVVGERGLKLSVGQKQRISIARAILHNPKILILDEPTSALDAGTEKIITESLEELMKGRTTFIIAHRLATVRRANQILVFKDGRIIERGTHKELLKDEDGEYRRLHDLQIGMHE